MLLRVRTNGLGIVIHAAQEPFSVPSILLQRLFLLFNEFGEGFHSYMIPAQFGQLGELTECIDMLLRYHNALSLALSAKGTEMVVPVGEKDQRQIMRA